LERSFDGETESPDCSGVEGVKRRDGREEEFERDERYEKIEEELPVSIHGIVSIGS
jgi:hypothetical protein